MASQQELKEFFLQLDINESSAKASETNSAEEQPTASPLTLQEMLASVKDLKLPDTAATSLKTLDVTSRAEPPVSVEQPATTPLISQIFKDIKIDLPTEQPAASPPPSIQLPVFATKTVPAPIPKLDPTPIPALEMPELFAVPDIPVIAVDPNDVTEFGKREAYYIAEFRLGQTITQRILAPKDICWEKTDLEQTISNYRAILRSGKVVRRDYSLVDCIMMEGSPGIRADKAEMHEGNPKKFQKFVTAALDEHKQYAEMYSDYNRKIRREKYTQAVKIRFVMKNQANYNLMCSELAKAKIPLSSFYDIANKQSESTQSTLISFFLKEMKRSNTCSISQLPDIFTRCKETYRIQTAPARSSSSTTSSPGPSLQSKTCLQCRHFRGHTPSNVACELKFGVVVNYWDKACSQYAGK